MRIQVRVEIVRSWQTIRPLFTDMYIYVRWRSACQTVHESSNEPWVLVAGKKPSVEFFQVRRHLPVALKYVFAEVWKPWKGSNVHSLFEQIFNASLSESVLVCHISELDAHMRLLLAS